MNFLDKVLDVVMTKKVLGTAIVIIVTCILVRILKSGVSKILTSGKTSFEAKRRKTIINLFNSVLKVVIWFIALLIILDFYGVDTRSLITSLGAASVVLGLALQDTLKDFISGVSLILENYLAVGDIVTYNDFTGEVIELGLRVTKIKDFNGEVMIIANRNIDSIINASQKSAHIYLEVDTAYEEESKKVIKVLENVLKKAIEEKLILSDSKYCGINELSSSSVKYMLDIHCDQNNKYKIKREILGRIKEAYDKNNIKIPYNQIEVHHGQDI